MNYFSSQTLVKGIWQSGVILLISVCLGLTLNHFRPQKLALVANWSPEAQLTLESGDTLAVSPDEAEATFASGSGVFLDARSPELYNEGHIKGALNLPWDEFENKAGEVLADINPETRIVTYCDGESCLLSKDLAFALLDRGYSNVRVLVNGWTIWTGRNLPVESGSKHP